MENYNANVKGFPFACQPWLELRQCPVFVVPDLRRDCTVQTSPTTKPTPIVYVPSLFRLNVQAAGTASSSLHGRCLHMYYGYDALRGKVDLVHGWSPLWVVRKQFVTRFVVTRTLRLAITYRFSAPVYQSSRDTLLDTWNVLTWPRGGHSTWNTSGETLMGRRAQAIRQIHCWRRRHICHVTSPVTDVKVASDEPPGP